MNQTRANHESRLGTERHGSMKPSLVEQYPIFDMLLDEDRHLHIFMEAESFDHRSQMLEWQITPEHISLTTRRQKIEINRIPAGLIDSTGGEINIWCFHQQTLGGIKLKHNERPTLSRSASFVVWTSHPLPADICDIMTRPFISLAQASNMPMIIRAALDWNGEPVSIVSTGVLQMVDSSEDLMNFNQCRIDRKFMADNEPLPQIPKPSSQSFRTGLKFPWLMYRTRPSTGFARPRGIAIAQNQNREHITGH